MTSLIWSSCAIGSAMAQDSLVTTDLHGHDSQLW